MFEAGNLIVFKPNAPSFIKAIPASAIKEPIDYRKLASLYWAYMKYNDQIDRGWIIYDNLLPILYLGNISMPPAIHDPSGFLRSPIAHPENWTWSEKFLVHKLLYEGKVWFIPTLSGPRQVKLEEYFDKCKIGKSKSSGEE